MTSLEIERLVTEISTRIEQMKIDEQIETDQGIALAMGKITAETGRGQGRRLEHTKAINDENVQHLINVQGENFDYCMKNITSDGKKGDWVWFFFPGAKPGHEPWGNSNGRKTFVYKRQYQKLIQTLKNQNKLQYWINIFKKIITEMGENKEKGKEPTDIKRFFHINPLDHGTMYFFFKTWGETISEWGHIDQGFTQLFNKLEKEFYETQCINGIRGENCSGCQFLIKIGEVPYRHR
jgi:hypothetical protein